MTRAMGLTKVKMKHMKGIDIGIGGSWPQLNLSLCGTQSRQCGGFQALGVLHCCQRSSKVQTVGKDFSTGERLLNLESGELDESANPVAHHLRVLDSRLTILSLKFLPSLK